MEEASSPLTAFSLGNNPPLSTTLSYLSFRPPRRAVGAKPKESAVRLDPSPTPKGKRAPVSLLRPRAPFALLDFSD
jgi:hypothetical protein